MLAVDWSRYRNVYLPGAAVVATVVGATVVIGISGWAIKSRYKPSCVAYPW